jgi:hypothetical protein
MKSIIAVTLTAFGLAILGSVAVLGYQDVEGHGHQLNTFTVDVAVDCRTAVDEFKRGANVIINGKLFPAGTLPSGPASNDPTLPVNGVAPIGDWLLRGQHSLPLLLPDDIAQRYRSAPGDFVTAYFILDGGRTSLIAESYAFLDETGLPTLAFAAVTGGVGRFRAAAGESSGPPIGTNATGCPNFSNTFKLVSASPHRVSDH